MNREELDKTIKEHGKWLIGEGGERANLQEADLQGANLQEADLQGANLQEADLQGANLQEADLQGANLRWANLQEADLQEAKGLVKLMGVEKGNYYWKAIDDELKNNGYQYNLGLNILNEEFAADERITCSYPGFHFASKSWCETYYPERKYLCKIRIPEDAQINEPWATDGKASADKIEILQVLLMDSKEDVTEQFKED